MVMQSVACHAGAIHGLTQSAQRWPEVKVCSRISRRLFGSKSRRGALQDIRVDHGGGVTVFRWPTSFTVGRESDIDGPDVAICGRHAEPVLDKKLPRRALTLNWLERGWTVTNTSQADFELEMALNVIKGTEAIKGGMYTLRPGVGMYLGLESTARIDLGSSGIFEVGFKLVTREESRVATPKRSKSGEETLKRSQDTQDPNATTP